LVKYNRVTSNTDERAGTVENFSYFGSANRGKQSLSRKNVQIWLGRFRNVQVRSTAAVLDFIVQFVDVV